MLGWIDGSIITYLEKSSGIQITLNTTMDCLLHKLRCLNERTSYPVPARSDIFINLTSSRSNSCLCSLPAEREVLNDYRRSACGRRGDHCP